MQKSIRFWEICWGLKVRSMKKKFIKICLLECLPWASVYVLVLMVVFVSMLVVQRKLRVCWL